MRVWYGRNEFHETNNYIFSTEELRLSEHSYKQNLVWVNSKHPEGSVILLCSKEAHKLLHKDDWLEPGEGPKEIEVLFGKQIFDLKEKLTFKPVFDLEEIEASRVKKLTENDNHEIMKLQHQIDHIKETYIELSIERWMAKYRPDTIAQKEDIDELMRALMTKEFQQTAHLCPKCQGQKTIHEIISQSATSGAGKFYDCPTCNGEGVLWK